MLTGITATIAIMAVFAWAATLSPTYRHSEFTRNDISPAESVFARHSRRLRQVAAVLSTVTLVLSAIVLFIS